MWRIPAKGLPLEISWSYDVGQELTYYAKKGEPASMTNYDFMIEFKDGKPRVWVEDADSYQSKNAIKDVVDSIIRNRQYSEYCINFNGTDYYANCKGYHDKIVGDFNIGFPAYVSGCTVGTLTCEGIWLAASGGFSAMTLLKDIPRTAITCAMQPAIPYLFARFSNTSTAYHAGESMGFLAQIGVGVFHRKKSWSSYSGREIRQVDESFVKQYGLFKTTLLGEGEGRITRDSIASIGNDIFRMNQEAAKIAGTDFKDMPVWKALGFDSEDVAKNALERYVANDKQLKKFLQKPSGDSENKKDLQNSVRS